MKIGYARVSTTEQNLNLQRDALKAASCDKVVEDTAGGGKADRPGWAHCAEILRPGDVLVVWRLDRLGRSLRHLIDLMTELEEEGIGCQSVTEAIDTTTPGGKLVFHIFGALAEFERESNPRADQSRFGSRSGEGPKRWPTEEARRAQACLGRRSLPAEEAHDRRDLSDGGN